APGAMTVAVLANPGSVVTEVRNIEEAARALGLNARFLRAGNGDELATALASLPKIKADALLVTNNPFFFDRRNEIVAYAARCAIPALYSRRELAAAGGLISYGSAPDDNYRTAGDYAGRILKGVSPGDLPVQQPTKFELVINLRTARLLGLTVPATLLAS